MELLLDPGASGTLRGLREPEPDLGTVHLPEVVASGGETRGDEAAWHAAEVLLAQRLRRIVARMIGPMRGSVRPR